MTPTRHSQSRQRELALKREQHRRDGLKNLLVVKNESIETVMRHLLPDFNVATHDKAVTGARRYEVVVLALNPSMDHYAEVLGRIRCSLKPDGRWVEL